MAAVPARMWKPTLDCADVGVTSAFWGWLLGTEVSGDWPTIKFLGPPDSRAVMCFQQVEERKAPGKNRLHLDLLVDDLDEVSAEVEQHGGRRLDGPLEIEGFGRWLVMADPEDNEFCLIALAQG
jgi:predicted enzyme related to lactoylglutathione lyase